MYIELSSRGLLQNNIQSLSDVNAADSLTSSTSSLLSQYATPPSDLVPQTTNTVEAAMSMMGNNQHHEFNQLFNFVNYIDQVELDAGQTSRIIIAFLPEDRENMTSSAVDADGGDGFLQASASENDLVSGETFDYFEVNGVIFFLCFKDSSKIPGGMTAGVVKIDLIRKQYF